MKIEPNKGSFRDASGSVYQGGDRIYRSIMPSFRVHFEEFVNSGLSSYLISHNLLVNFSENTEISIDRAWKTLEVEKIDPVSYAYEWSFSQLKDAALLTLNIQEAALGYNLTLKDASAYNVQFRNGKPIFIDILSFEKYKAGKPWTAYAQFCSHFLAPLALMAKTDIRLNLLAQIWLDGVPLDLAVKLLPWKTRINPALLIHLHAHAALRQKHANNLESAKKMQRVSVSKTDQLRLTRNLIDTVKKLALPKISTEWGNYYGNTNYTDEAFEAKKIIVDEVCQTIKPGKILDIGANSGEFSTIAAKHSSLVVAADIDPLAVEKNYLALKATKSTTNVLPLLINLTNPSPSIGWHNQERDSFLKRSAYDLTLALALIHHLAIGNNIPFAKIAELFSEISTRLLIEYIPKEDSKVQLLLASREDIFTAYNIEGFKSSFMPYYKITKTYDIPASKRTLFLMEKRT